MPASGGGFDVNPPTILSGSARLKDAIPLSGIGDSLASQAGAAAAGEGPLAGDLEQFGVRLSWDSGQLEISLSETATVLEAIAEAYTRSDEPLPGAP